MNVSRNTKIGALAIAAVALVAAGGAFAAGKFHGSKATATGGYSAAPYSAAQADGTARGPRGMRFGFGFGRAGDLAAAATYLGLGQSTLQADLQSGKTLAQIADATDGKSSSGLIDALVTAEQAQLAAAVTAGTITQAQADQITATLKDRITSMVNGTPSRGGYRGGGFGFGRGGDLAAAATYLGLGQSTLQADLQSGKTLAQIADATDGKSSSGLIDALVTAEQAQLAAAVTAGTITQAQADQITATLKDRISSMVNGTRPLRGGYGGGLGPTPPRSGFLKPSGSTHI